MQHFLQSPAWGRFQQLLGRKVTSDSGDGWSYLAIHETGRFNTRLYCPYGPYAKSNQAFDLALHSLTTQAKTQHVTFLRVEPTGAVTAAHLQEVGFKKVTYNQLQPEHTQIIDLNKSEEEIVAAMDQTNRNLYRNYEKKGLSMQVSQNPDDIEILITLLRGVAKRKGIHTHSDTYFRTQAKALFPTGDAKLFYATYENKPIAASVVLDSSATRYYIHAGSDDAFRKLSAGTALLAYMIVDARRNGLAAFDLYGIAPTNDPTHPWAGFTKFKKSFGGEPFTYVGAWDLPIAKPQYLFYRLYQQLTRKR